MARRKETERAEAKAVVHEACQYTKEQLAGSDYFRPRRDLVEALLTSGRKYTIREAEQVIKEFLKGKVSLC